MSAVSTRALTKIYSGTAVVSDLDLEVPTGAIYGFIGANGAGKTTTLKMLLGLVAASSGGATVLGVNRGTLPATPIPGVAYLPDVPQFQSWLTASEAMRLFADLSAPGTPAKRIATLLEMVGLPPKGRVGGFSRGMKQRLGIACALVGNPELLILDEPTSALDPIGRTLMLEIIAALKGKATVVFSSHLLDDVQKVATHVGILDRGVLRAQGTLAEVLALAPKSASRLEVSGSNEDVERARDLLADLPGLELSPVAASLQQTYNHLLGVGK